MGILVINKISIFVLRMKASIKPANLCNYTRLIAIKDAKVKNYAC